MNNLFSNKRIFHINNGILQLLFVVLFFLSCNNDKQTEEELDFDKIAAIENTLLPGKVLKGDSIKSYSISTGMKQHHIPGISIAVANEGKIDWARGYGIANAETGTKVDSTTLFQAASISKPITALAILKMMEEGKVALDTDVNTYLKDWKVPENKFTQIEKVTLRRLLTHSAGTTVHGFPGYQKNDSLPSTKEVLDGKGNTAAVIVDTIPGSQFKYSGGGYTIVQKLLEDITGMPFDAYMDTHILQPLGMTHSTYAQPLPETQHKKASAAYDGEGRIIEGFWHNYPEMAAAGLWTTPSDLLKYAIEMQQIFAGKTDGLLKPETVRLMFRKDGHGHGLGPGLEKDGDSLIFSHTGQNAGYTDVLIAFAAKGRALAIMTNADNGGRLLGAIERAVSAQYEWGLSEPEVIDTVALSNSYLTQFSGTWKYIEQVPSAGGDYIAKARVENGQLVIDDVPEKTEYNFVALDSLTFLDLDKNDRVIFKTDGDETVLWWSDTFEFHKIDPVRE